MRSNIDLAATRTRTAAFSIPVLNHLRWLAALVVVSVHIKDNFLNKAIEFPYNYTQPRGLVTKAIYLDGGYGRAAVVVFFVLSGFLVGGKLVELLRSNDINQAWHRFFFDRATRIFIVAWPAIVLTAIVVIGLIWIVPTAPFVASSDWSSSLSLPIATSDSASVFAASIFLLNEFVQPTLVTNNPLWSLAYEWSYYMMSLAMVLIYRRVISIFAIAVIVYGLGLAVLAFVNQPDVLVSGLAWLAGLGARVVSNSSYMTSRLGHWGGIGLFGAALLIYRLHPLPDPVLACAVAVMIAHNRWKSLAFAPRLGEVLANFSYSIYVTHFPMLLVVLAALSVMGWLPMRGPNPHGLALACATLAIVLMAAWVFALATEHRTDDVRQALIHRFIVKRQA